MDSNSTNEYHYDPVISEYFFTRYDFIALFVITSFLRIIVYYIVATQSDTLGVFKYYILNQMIWSHLFEVIMMISNPVLILPYGCGFVSGVIGRFLTNTDMALGLIVIGFFIAAVKFVSTILSATNRFLFTFKPHLRKYIDNKYFFSVLAFGFVVFLGIIAQHLYASEATYASLRERAMQETGTVLVKYFDRPTFVYARNNGQKVQTSYIFLLIYCNLYSLFMICIIAWFIRSVFKLRKTAKTVSQATISLLFMTLIQLFTNVIFLIMPMSVVLASAGFFIEGSANLANALVSMITYHGLVEMLGVLYSVVPYRKYCVKKMFCINDSQVFVGVPKGGSVIRAPRQKSAEVEERRQKSARQKSAGVKERLAKRAPGQLSAKPKARQGIRAPDKRAPGRQKSAGHKSAAPKERRGTLGSNRASRSLCLPLPKLELKNSRSRKIPTLEILDLEIF